MKFDSPKILIFHPGKCAGTSVEIPLVKEYLGEEHSKLGPVKNIRKDILYGWVPEHRVYLQHCDIDYLLKYTDVNPNDYTSYCFVRNPYHRLVSAYYYNMILERTGMSFEEFVINPNGLESRYHLNKNYTINHFGPMSKFTHHPEYVVDHIGKVESIDEDFSRFFKNLSLPKHKAAKTVASNKHEDYMDLYSKEMKDKVYELFREDFVNYGYVY